MIRVLCCLLAACIAIGFAEQSFAYEKDMREKPIIKSLSNDELIDAMYIDPDAMQSFSAAQTDTYCIV